MGAHELVWNFSPTTLPCLWALLVYDAEEPLRAVEQHLLAQGISTRRVRNCSEVLAMLRESFPPAVVVTDTSLPDGGWADVLKATCACPSYPPLIVVSRLADVSLYLDIMESGAYDLVVPPLASADLAHIVNGALLKSSHQSLGKTQKPMPSGADHSGHPSSSLRPLAARSGAHR